VDPCISPPADIPLDTILTIFLRVISNGEYMFYKISDLLDPKLALRWSSRIDIFFMIVGNQQMVLFLQVNHKYLL